MENLSPQVIRQVTREVVSLAESPPEGIKVFVNEQDITDIHATIEGPGMRQFYLGRQGRLVSYDLFVVEAAGYYEDWCLWDDKRIYPLCPPKEGVV